LVIVSGGFKCFRETPDQPAADWAITKGAIDRLREDDVRTETRIETLLPDPERDPDPPNVIRFEEGNAYLLRGRSRLARSFKLVAATDVVLAVEGSGGTSEMIDLALALDKPVLPLPFTGGCAMKKWRDNRDIIQEWFDIDEKLASELESRHLDTMSSESLTKLAIDITSILLRQLKRRCFVMMPFSPRCSSLYEMAIKPGIENAGYIPVRTDRLDLVGNVMAVLRASINASACALAVITGKNPNVMYELGLAHAMDKPVILLSEYTKNRKITRLPFDLRHEYVIGYAADDVDELRAAIISTIAQLNSN
jgi:hypothetical protein